MSIPTLNYLYRSMACTDLIMRCNISTQLDILGCILRGATLPFHLNCLYTTFRDYGMSGHPLHVLDHPTRGSLRKHVKATMLSKYQSIVKCDRQSCHQCNINKTTST